MRGIAVETRNLTHQYGERRALDDVSLSVSAGEFFGVLGPNGGGKSTLFKILSTLIRPTSGEVRVAGENLVIRPDAVRRALGVVFQSPALDKKLTVYENLWAEGRLHGWGGSDLKREIEQLLSMFALADRKDERSEKLSGGLRRRVEIARALLHRPSILLLDEPTTGLDPLARREIWNYLKTLQKSQGLTLLWTTHLLDEAEQCERIAILNQGRVVAMDTPENLKRASGADVVWIKTPEPSAVLERLRGQFSLSPTIVDGDVCFEHGKGHELVAPLISALGELVESVRVGKPTLEDFFIKATGKRFFAAGAHA